MRALHFHNSISVKHVLFLWLTLCLLPGIAQATGSHYSNQNKNHAGDNQCDNSITVPLLINEQIQVGVVKVTYDEYNLTIKYIANDGWLIEKTRLAVADSFEGLPQDRYGNPSLRRFPHQTSHQKPVSVVNQMLSSKQWQVGTELYIAAQANVVALKPMKQGKIRYKADSWSGKWSKNLKTSDKLSGHERDYGEANEHNDKASRFQSFKRFSKNFFAVDDKEENHRHNVTCLWKDKDHGQKNTGSKAKSAWAKGFKFPGGKEGFYFTYLLKPCKPVVDSNIQFSAPVYNSSEDEASARITVVRSGNLSQPATVQFFTTDGTAIGGVDYVAVAKELTFAPDVAELDVFIPIIDDSEVEEVKTVNLQLSDAEGASLGEQDTAVLEIADNDEIVPQLDTFIFEPPVYVTRESGDFVIVTVIRQGNLVGEASVDYAATGGTALSPRDYELMPGTLVFPDGVDTATFMVIINEDRIPDGNVTVEISLANPVNAELGAPANALLTIEDNEVPN